MRVLAIGAHPDDLEQLCGGTLARYVADGHDVTMCHVSAGDRGSYEHSMSQIRQIRGEEAATAATIIGAHYLSLGFSDGDINAASHEQKEAVIDAIRYVRPDVILTHSPDDYMPDHNETSRLVDDASFVATLPLYETQHPVHKDVAAVFYMDTLAGSGFYPTEFVDISEQMDTKLRALDAHRSQIDWLRDHDGVDILEQTRVLSALRGFQSGVRYAEGFRANLRWLRARTRRLLP